MSIMPFTSMAECKQMNELEIGAKSAKEVSGIKLAHVQNYSKPNMSSCLDSNNNSDMKYAGEIKTEIKTEPDDPVSHSVDINNCSEAESLSDMISKQKHLCSNHVPDKQVSEIKKEPVDGLSNHDSRNCAKPFEENISSFNLEILVKRIKSEPIEKKIITQTDSKISKNPSKMKGAFALRERLLIYPSINQIKQEPPVNLTTKSANTPYVTEPNITPNSDNDYNKMDKEFERKVNIEIKKEPEEVVSEAVSIYNYSNSGLLPGLTKSKVPDEIISKIKKEPLDDVFDMINTTNNFGTETHQECMKKHKILGNKENIKENLNSVSNLGGQLKVNKSEQNKVFFRVIKAQNKSQNSRKLRGAIALRERLLVHGSKIQIKPEPIEKCEYDKNANVQEYNPDKENQDPKMLCQKQTKQINSHRKMKANELEDKFLPSNSQNERVDNRISYDRNSEYNIVLNCHGNLSPHLMKQFGLKKRFDLKAEPKEGNEKTSNNEESQTKEVFGNIFPCHIISGIVVNYLDFNSEYLYVKNWFAELVPLYLPGPPHKICALKVLLGCIHSQTLICLERGVFINGTAIQCKYINIPTKVQFDGIWNRKEGNFSVFVIWQGNKPYNNSNQSYIHPESTDYFDIAGTCSSVDNVLKIHIDKLDFTLQCSATVTAFLNYNEKVLVIPDDTSVDLYLRKYNSSEIKQKWQIISMILYL